jgi:hypothetical protein
MSFDEVDVSLRSEQLFSSYDQAYKAAHKKFGFRTYLVQECQNEYIASVKKVSIVPYMYEIYTY